MSTEREVMSQVFLPSVVSPVIFMFFIGSINPQILVHNERHRFKKRMQSTSFEKNIEYQTLYRTNFKNMGAHYV
jgi:hypothetical protein